MTAKVNFEVEDDSVLEQIVTILGTFSSVHNVHVADKPNDEDLSFLQAEIQKGLRSGRSTKSHSEIMDKIKEQYA